MYMPYVYECMSVCGMCIVYMHVCLHVWCEYICVFECMCVPVCVHMCVYVYQHKQTASKIWLLNLFLMRSQNKIENRLS